MKILSLPFAFFAAEFLILAFLLWKNGDLVFSFFSLALSAFFVRGACIHWTHWR